MPLAVKEAVSVPLRGLVMWKPSGKIRWYVVQAFVSVPLRGLVMWKHQLLWLRLPEAEDSMVRGTGFCFSPLAGISYVETPPSET